MQKKINIIISTVLIIAATVFVISAADVFPAGSEQDPIVTQSYVEQKSEQMKFYVDSLITTIKTDVFNNSEQIKKLQADLAAKSLEVDNLKKQLETAGTGATTATGQEKFTKVVLNKGKTLVMGESTELIIKTGKCTAIAAKNGGVTDLTYAKDLKTGDPAGLNHLLFAFASDGRGIKASLNSIVLVKGSYEIK